MSEKVVRVVQIVAAAAGWRVAHPREVVWRASSTGEVAERSWRVTEEPIACFALCDLALETDGIVASDTWQQILPVLSGEDLMSPWTDDDMGASRLVGPGFVAVVDKNGYIDTERAEDIDT